ncbi:MAG TPA: hypothetical protein VJ945_00935 [Flavobacteriaceae bacterium]|nr:hypothetical protein [Flavobacteriaceae bacterium]
MTNNLKTFGILYLIKGILNLLFVLFFMAYAVFGLFLMNSDQFRDDTIGFNPGTLLIGIGSVGACIAFIFGILTLMVPKYLKETRNYNFILVVAVLNCLTGVLGILLGVFTIIELNKPEVRKLFDKEN